MLPCRLLRCVKSRPTVAVTIRLVHLRQDSGRPLAGYRKNLTGPAVFLASVYNAVNGHILYVDEYLGLYRKATRINLGIIEKVIKWQDITCHLFLGADYADS